MQVSNCFYYINFSELQEFLLPWKHTSSDVKINDVTFAIKFTKFHCWTNLNLFLYHRNIFEDCSEIFGNLWYSSEIFGKWSEMFVVRGSCCFQVSLCRETLPWQHQKTTHLKRHDYCAQFTQKRQERPNAEVYVSEVYFHVHGYILGFLEPKRIFHTKSIKMENNTVDRSWAWVACDTTEVRVHCQSQIIK